MAETNALSVVASSDLIEDLAKTLREAGVRISEPAPATSPADALDAPMGASQDEIYEIVTVMLVTGADVSAFADHLTGALERHPALDAVLRDARSGKRRGRARRGVSSRDVVRMVSA
jgi:hypothetical protein